MRMFYLTVSGLRFVYVPNMVIDQFVSILRSLGRISAKEDGVIGISTTVKLQSDATILTSFDITTNGAISLSVSIFNF